MTMRVLQLTQRFPPALGGVESHVYHLAMDLSKTGISTEVFTTDLQRDTPFTRLEDGCLSLPFPVRRFRATKYLDLPHGLGILAPSMARALLRDRPDIIHAHAYGYFPMFAGGLAEMICGVPLVVTPHSDPGLGSLSKRLFDWAMPPITLRRAHRVIALTAIEQQHLQQLGVAPGRIRIIPNGVDLNEFADLPGRSRSSDETHLLFVGRCYPRQKGLEHLVKATALLSSRRKVRLSIVGEDWGGVASLQTMSKALGVEEQVTFTGPVPRGEVIRSYAGADIFVLPSLFEPFGIVLLEAMAAGLPIVASRVGGIVDVVEEGKTALLVPPGNSQALAEALDRVISDASLRRRMGDAARRRVLAYSWSRLLPRILEVYEEAIAECGVRRAG